MAYILTHELWGVLCLPEYPSLWSFDPGKAYVFRTRADARRMRRRWNEAVPVRVRTSAAAGQPYARLDRLRQNAR